jgi:hypothetical protein
VVPNGQLTGLKNVAAVFALAPNTLDIFHGWGCAQNFEVIETALAFDLTVRGFGKIDVPPRLAVQCLSHAQPAPRLGLYETASCNPCRSDACVACHSWAERRSKLPIGSIRIQGKLDPISH